MPEEMQIQNTPVIKIWFLIHAIRKQFVMNKYSR